MVGMEKPSDGLSRSAPEGCAPPPGQDVKHGGPQGFHQEEESQARAGDEDDGGGMDFGVWSWVSHHVQWPDPGPTLIAARIVLAQTMEKLRALVQLSWPLIKTWSGLGSRAMILLGFWSRECVRRGFASLFKLGSAALFLLVWCTAFCMGILAGFFNLGIALILSLAAGSLLGYTASFALICLFGAVVLWMFGSFWTTLAIVVFGGGLFVFDHARTAILVTMLYSVHSVQGHGGWMALLLCTILAFISSDFAIYFLSKSGGNQGGGHDRKTSNQDHEHGKSNFHRSHHHASKTRPAAGTGAVPGQEVPAWSTESVPNSERQKSSLGASPVVSSERGDPTSNSAGQEVTRVLSCCDHYAVLGFARYDNVDVAVLKREYRKSAMLVHPDKNRGNEKAEEAFKLLQNAYEVLLDSSKKRVYDDELRREEVLMNFRHHRQKFHPAGRCLSPHCGCQYSDNEAEDDVSTDLRSVVCRVCHSSHLWISTDRSKLRARWCQECQDHHQAKDGDGWVEQSGQSFLFGMFQKVDVPRAFVCADGKVYDVTEWVICQGMKCPANTHKPTFQVSTGGSVRSTTRGPSRASRSGGGGGGRGSPPEGFSFSDFDENMTEHEFFDWLEAAMASGMFGDLNGVPSYPGGQEGTKGGKPNKKKRKGRKQW